MTQSVLYRRDVTIARSAARQRMMRRRRITISVVGVCLLAASYTGMAACAPLPQLQRQLTLATEQTFVADGTAAQTIVDAYTLPTAVGWLDSEHIWSNSDQRYRIASLTKLITVLVALEHKPLDPEADGELYTLTEADERITEEMIAHDGSFVTTVVGLQLTEQQLLELILVPSANNYAVSYARWVFGSDEQFLEAARAWLTKQQLDSVTIVDASGMSDDNVATPADLVRLSRLALAHPTIASIVAQRQITIAGIGEFENSNTLLHDAQVIGVKTGTTFPHGYSLSAASRGLAGDRTVVAIVVTLDRPDGATRTAETRSALTAMLDTPQTMPIIEQGTTVGFITAWTGEQIPLTAATAAEAVLLPGEQARTSIELAVPHSAAAAGSNSGLIRIAAPSGSQIITLVTTAPIVEPGLWWRVTHPNELFATQFS